ncbi:hypothetical protein AB6825_22490 [Serratia proteamaculans]|uniref:MrpH family fimbial adhesin n=1 Tax=Serratia proteamaculans TaxID=28151 RepID=UPI0021BD2DCA|nr:hypothetical protein [Serratia proteamaculans]
MKLSLFWMIGFIMLLVGYTGNALARPYVTVDKLTVTKLPNYSPGQPGANSNDFAGQWDWKEQSGDVSICNSTKRGGCVVALCTRHVWYQCLSTDGGMTISGMAITVPNGTTAAQAQVAWAAKYGTSGYWSIRNWQMSAMVDLREYCIGITIYPRSNSDLSEFIPGSNCAEPPPPDLSCITSGKVTIDYGTLDGSKLNGATASTNLSFTCNQAATATIKLNDNVIDLGRKGDLTAAISIGGKDLAIGSDVAVKSGTVTTTITSTLKAKGTPAAGAFEGSGVLIIGYQ